MEINVSKIEPEVMRLHALINDYIDNYSKMYGILSDITYYWHDINCKRFLNNLSKEKLLIFQNIKELNDTYKIYSYMISEYSKIGKKIKVNLGNKEKVNTTLNKYIINIKSIIDVYNSLNLQYYNDLRIYNQKQKFIDMKSNIEKRKKDIMDLFSKVENIEKKINNDLSKIELKKITEIKTEQYI